MEKTEEEVANAFTPFWRARNSESQVMNGKGNGVGLSICKKICECLEGDISISSRKGFGSTITFTMNAYFTPKNTVEEVEGILNFR